MVIVEFAPSLRRHVDCPQQSLAVSSLRDALEVALVAAPALSHYVFDDQRAIRKHVAVFINDQMLRDRTQLDVMLVDGDRILVIQALSGG